MAPRSKRQYVHDLNRGALRLARTLSGARQSRFPGFVGPSLATPAARPPRGNDWLHEVKYDGYRFQCHIQRGIRFYTRRGHDWSERLSHLGSFMTAFSQHALIFDGEVIVQTPEGRSDFHALEKELKVKGGSWRLVNYVFDLLYLDAFDLRRCPLVGRKQVLQELFSDIDGPVKVSEHLEGDGIEIWTQRATAPGGGPERCRDQPIHLGEAIDEERHRALQDEMLRLEPCDIQRLAIYAPRAEAEEGVHLVNVAPHRKGIIVEASDDRVGAG